MLSPISSASSASAVSLPSSSTTNTQAAAKTAAPQDTVHLSAAAQEAVHGGGDADHDGDAH